MSDLKKVRPRDGLKIRDPFTGHVIPPEGADVLMTGNFGTVILKHIKAGDLVEVAEAPVVVELGVDKRRGENVLSAVKTAKKGEG
jgi:Protein of unknown function (DUF2635)